MLNIQTDSRKIKPGDTFVAVKCEINDGHKYVDAAIKAGATKVVVERGSYDVETLVVDDTRKYINEYLSTNYKKEIDEMTLIAITGTNGKTTSAYLTYQMLNKLGVKASYIGTIGFYMNGKVESIPNTSLDICDTYDLLMKSYDKGYKTVILEASSIALAGDRLSILKFDYAVFTNLTQDHLDYHKTMENYALAKQILFKDRLKESGKAVINVDDKWSNYFLLDNNTNITFGKNGHYSYDNYVSNLDGLSFDLKIDNKTYPIKSKLMGEYNVYNLLTMISIVNDMFEIEDIIKYIPELNAPSGRIETIDYKTNKIVIDYAHTPDAIEKILNAVNTTGKKYVVFGCTGDRDRTKRPIMGKLVSELSDYFIITDDDPHNEDEMQIVNDIIKNKDFSNYSICLDRKEAIKKGIELLDDKDVLFILGKGHEEFIIKGNERIPHNDKEEVLKIINEKLL